MKSFFDYIYKGSQTNEESDQQPEHKQMIKIDIQQLNQLHQQLNKFGENMLKSMVQKDSRIISTFQDLMGTLHGLINVVGVMRGEAEQTYYKVNDYDRMKTLVSAHHEMIAQLQQDESNKINELYSINRKLKEEKETLINELVQQKLKLESEVHELMAQKQHLVKNNKELAEEMLMLANKVKILQKQYHNTKKELDQLVQVKSQSIQPQKNFNLNELTLEKLLVYSKIRKFIYPYLDLKDALELSLASKRFNYLIKHSFRNQIVPTILKAQIHKIQQSNQQSKQYQKIYDKFPVSNIKTNAIKYLYYKIKPGHYILPFLQQEYEEKSQEKKSMWKSIFGKKENKQAKPFDLAIMKGQQEFKEVSHKIDMFFDKLFKIEMPEDFEIYQMLMQKQLDELRQSLKGSDRWYQLLNMSKFLFLEVSELNNLLQVCFGELINEHYELVKVAEKNRDLTDNDKTLRELVQHMANDKRQIEKRLWFLQNQTIKLKSINEKTEESTFEALNKRSQLQSKIADLSSELTKTKQEYQKEKKIREKTETQMSQIISVLQEKQSLIDNQSYN